MEQNLRNRIERSENILSRAGNDLKTLDTSLPIIENVLEVVDRSYVFQVSFVVLQDIGNLIDRNVLFRQVVFQILKAFDIFFHFLPLRIGHKNDPVYAA